MKKALTVFVLMLFAGIFLGGCNKIGQKARPCGTRYNPTGIETYSSNPNYSNNYARYNISADNVPLKASKLKETLLSIENAYIESFSAREDSANMTAYVPVASFHKVSELIAGDAELTITNYSESMSSSSDYLYIKKYHAYKALLDNFDEVKSVLEKKKQKC